MSVSCYAPWFGPSPVADPADRRAAQGIIDTAFRGGEARDGFAHAADAAGNQDRWLNLAARLAKRALRFGVADARDRGDDSACTFAQFRIIGLQIDHQALMNMAKPKSHQR